jgi:hypothetical protein
VLLWILIAAVAVVLILILRVGLPFSRKDSRSPDQMSRSGPETPETSHRGRAPGGVVARRREKATTG